MSWLERGGSMSARLRSGMGSGGMWAMGRLGRAELGLLGS